MLVVIGVLLWLLQRYVPMDPTIMRIIVGVVIVATVIWLLQIVGLLDYATAVRVPRIHG